MAEPDEVLEADVVVVGSGAGGATVAALLAEAGSSVLVAEEGPPGAASRLATHSPDAMLSLYRHAGLLPILGRQSIAFVEGRCLGGSTEINSAFWHRLPPPVAERWQREHGLVDLTPEWLASTFVDLERQLQVQRAGGDSLPASSRIFRRGLERLDMPAEETPRAQTGNPTGHQFAPGAKQSMSRTYVPRAQRAGARVISGCRVERLHLRGGRAVRASAVRRTPEGDRRLELRFESLFLCAGATQTPVLLRRSGIRGRVGRSLAIQPMLKVAAEFNETLDAHASVMPAYQMRDPASGIFLGGSVFTPGFLGITLADRWPENADALENWRNMGLYYAACRGTGRGSVSAFPRTGEAVVRYALSPRDLRNLSNGMHRLCEVLFAGGARRIYPGLRDCAPVSSLREARRRLGERVPAARMSLSTVHLTSSCPIGDDPRRSALDLEGRVRGLENVRVADASALPEAPGVNPQGTIMALASRTAQRFLESA